MNARHLVIPAVIAAAFAATPVLAAEDTLRQDPGAPSAYQQDPAPVSVKADDKSISSQVEAAVANDNIKAKAKDGVVTLKGKVDSRESADAAIQRASTVPGVVSVKSELKIKS
ncbi:MAG TPA: BON domain-containing protein [Moraxellaceae bacterium]